MKKIVKLLINEHNKKFWLWVLVCGALFGFFYQTIVMPDHQSRFKEFLRYKYLNLNRKVTELTLDFPMKDTYLLRLKGGINEQNQPAEVFINGNLLKEYSSRRKQVAGTTYRIIPFHLVQKGKNRLTIVCKEKPSYRLGIWCRNYRKELSDRKIFLLFDSSTHLSDHFAKVKIITASLIGSLLLSSIWLLISHGSIRLLYASRRKIYSYGLVSVMPSLLIFSIFYLASVCSPYHIVTTSTFFWNWVILLPAVLYCSLIACSTWLKYKRTKRTFKSMHLPSIDLYKAVRLFKQPSLNQNAVNAIEWVESRGLSDKFILLFMFLLIACAFWLVLGVKMVAEFLANIAFFLLAAGVFIRLFKFLKEGRIKGGQDSSEQY